jgi:polyisoprenoid-binding protein YceI
MSLTRTSAGVLIGTMVLSGALAQSVYAAPRTFLVGDKQKRDVASFTSDAPVELIVGHTSAVSGKVTMDESFDLSKPVEATFEVDLASIDTGIPLRNEHMRDNFLETAKYPKATFVLKKIENPTTLKSGQKVTLQATGDFSLHGKTVSKKVPVEVTYIKKCPQTESAGANVPAKQPGCDLLQLKATFNVPFNDHSIKRPEIVFQKLADTVIVTVAATAYSKATDAATAKSSNAKKPAESKPAEKKPAEKKPSEKK